MKLGLFGAFLVCLLAACSAENNVSAAELQEQQSATIGYCSQYSDLA